MAPPSDQTWSLFSIIATIISCNISCILSIVAALFEGCRDHHLDYKTPMAKEKHANGELNANTCIINIKVRPSKHTSVHSTSNKLSIIIYINRCANCVHPEARGRKHQGHYVIISIQFNKARTSKSRNAFLIHIIYNY